MQPVSVHRHASIRSDEAQRGQILVLFSLFLIVLIGFAAVAVDLGSYLKVRRDYQNASDAAALAGAPFLLGPSPDRLNARKAAWTSLSTQLGITLPTASPLPWDNDTAATSPVVVGPYSMWVSTPPINSGAKYPGAQTSSTDKSIFVWVEAQNPSYLSRIFGINGSLVDAWATAGLFPNRFAVITLRQPTQAGPPQADVNLAGNNVSLTVIGGDVGGNYNMKLNSNNNLVLPGDSQVYLHDYVSCGSSCWGNIQINNGGTPPPMTLKTALQLPGPIPDPNYPLPTNVVGAPTTPTASLPYGYTNSFPSADRRSAAGVVRVGSGGDSPANQSVTMVGGVATCDGANAVRIGPGFYKELTVAGNYCVILDPTYTHNCLSNGNGCTDTPTAVPATQMPGVFYFGGTTSGSGINIGNGAMVVGDGVTLVVRPTNGSPDKNVVSIAGGSGSPAIMDLNNGASPLVSTAEKSGAWTRRGVQPFSRTSSGCLYSATDCWAYTSAYESDATQTGMALYVMRRDQIPGLSVASDNNSIIVAVNASAALSWTGITYAPHDNVTLAGQPGHNGVGQLVSWTFTFNGGTDVTQTYAGPLDAIPLLIEPKLGQP